jgi:hypothetical protein
MRHLSLFLAPLSLVVLAGCENILTLDLVPSVADTDGDGVTDDLDNDDDNDGIDDDDDNDDDGDGIVDPPPDGVLTTAQVFERLSPTCQGCHTLTASPYFRDLQAFESLLVTNPDFVVAGNPEASRLLRMMAGVDSLPMPPAPNGPFASLEEAGETNLTTVQLTEWIRNLPPPVDVPVDVPLVRRKTAEMIERTLYDQLGLTDEDFYSVYNAFGITVASRGDDFYSSRSPDAFPSADYYGAGQAATVNAALGGAWLLEGRVRNDKITGTFLQAFTHLSQAWCRIAAQKQSPALFTIASVSDGTGDAGSLQRVRDNIRAWHLRMLGIAASDADVDELVNIFQAYEARGTEAAWTATCATLVRDPLWITY